MWGNNRGLINIFEDPQGSIQMADGDTLWFKHLFFTKPFAEWFLKRFLPPPDRRWTFARWTSLTRWISAATRLSSYPPFLDPKWLWGRGDGGGDGPACFLLVQRISTPVAMSFCLKVQRSDGKERCSYWVFPGEETLDSQQPFGLPVTEFIHCLQMDALTLDSHIQWPHALTLAGRPLPNAFLNTPPQSLNFHLLYFWFAVCPGWRNLLTSVFFFCYRSCAQLTVVSTTSHSALVLFATAPYWTHQY